MHYQFAQDRISTTFTKLKDIKTKIVSKRSETAAAIECAQIDNPFVEASDEEFQAIREARRNIRYHKQKLATLDQHQQTVDVQLEVAESNLSMMAEFGEVGRKMSERPGFDMDLFWDLLVLREKLTRGKYGVRRAALMVRDFPMKDLD